MSRVCGGERSRPALVFFVVLYADQKFASIDAAITDGSAQGSGVFLDAEMCPRSDRDTGCDARAAE
jgi:hypothetical protein